MSYEKRPVEFAPPSAFGFRATSYDLMPIRMRHLPYRDQILLTSCVGDHQIVSSEEYRQLVALQLDQNTHLFKTLRSRHLVCDSDTGPLFEAIEAQNRTRKNHVTEGPALHIFVLTLRCDHRCLYCQVTPQKLSACGFDMDWTTALQALDRVFESSADILTIEFQGGEAALSFDLLRQIVDAAEERALREHRTVRFVMTTTLQLLDILQLEFCRDHVIELSTSLDGPEFLHNANRPNGTGDSWKRTIDAIKRANEICGKEHVSALTTVSRFSLPHARAIIDTYVEAGLETIALRPLSPFGFAVKSARKLGYSAQEFMRFYEEAITYLIELNLQGIQIEETYASLLLTRILTPFPTSYVDLQSPAAAGHNVLVYNYDGGAYVSDEGRMLAEMGDNRFRMGSVNQSLSELHASPAMKIIDINGVAEELSGCRDCAFVPFCGADPVFHVATQGNPTGDRATSEFCRRQTGYFELFFDYIARNDPKEMSVFLSWITRKPLSQLISVRSEV
tara:strand:+ start:1691 stop:3208 length:1518 start_codon:yes stop_codon:yes gene_type:complete